MTDTIITPPGETTAPFPHPAWCDRARWTDNSPAGWTDAEEEDETHRSGLYYADSMDYSDVSVTFQLIRRFERDHRGRVLHQQPVIEVVTADREGPGRPDVHYNVSEWEHLMAAATRVGREIHSAYEQIESGDGPPITAG